MFQSKELKLTELIISIQLRVFSSTPNCFWVLDDKNPNFRLRIIKFQLAIILVEFNPFSNKSILFT